MTYATLWLIALVHPKIRQFVRGRRNTFREMESKIDPGKPLIWVHTASLGEYEQGLPILEKIRENYPGHQVLLSFFSPSGYEVKHEDAEADVVVYLPIDSLKNARKFISLSKPDLAIFIKYEIWPNFLRELERQHVPTLLVSALFREEHVFFKKYGGFMRKALKRFTHICVQDENSRQLLEEKGFESVSVSGDTRFDRVATIAEEAETIEVVAQFKGDKLCFVAGSSWPEDDELLVHAINSGPQDIQYVIAPHKIDKEKISDLAAKINRKVCYWSSIDSESEIPVASVLILDTIGLLSRVYRSADFAYVGGGFATGLHNTLEPAVFGIPVMIGPDFKQFREARELVSKNGILVIHEKEELVANINRLYEDKELRRKTGEINRSYVSENTGATKEVMTIIEQTLRSRD